MGHGPKGGRPGKDGGDGEIEPEEVQPPRSMTRREMLRHAGMAGAAAGAAAVVPGALGAAAPSRRTELPVVGPSGGAIDAAAGVQGVPDVVPPGATAPGRAATGFAAQVIPRPPHNFTVAEFELLDAMVARIIPTDELGPGAREAGAIYYIDREVGGALADQKQAYQLGLAALARYSQYSRGRPFTELSELEQDSLLIDVQGGSATATGAGFVGSSAAFFNMVRGHTLQGMFADPYYGGNQGYIGWDLLRYPGVRNGLNASDQARLEADDLAPSRRSAYDH